MYVCVSYLSDKNLLTCHLTTDTIQNGDIGVNLTLIYTIKACTEGTRTSFWVSDQLPATFPYMRYSKIAILG